MSGLVSLWKKHQDKRRSVVSSTESNDSVTSHTSPLHRKIHPDLDSLVAQLGDHHADDSTEPTALSSTTVPSASDFIPLKPRKTRRPYSVPPHPRPLSFVAESQDILEQEERQSTTISTASPAPGDVWSTFGRGRKLSSLTPLDSLTSTPGASGSRDMRGNTQFRTPTSTSHSTEGSSSISRSTQTRSRGSPSIHNDMFLTAHRPSPSSSSYHTFGRHRSSPYVPTERPPPLPPLDHPAFQSLGYRRQVSSSNIQHVVLPGKRPRRFASLPSLSIASPPRLQTISGTSKYIRSARRAHRKTSGPLHQIDEPNDSTTRVLHPVYQRNITPTAANESRRSGHNSRRSSPEYSHEQAATSIDAQESGGGEAQVSRQGFEAQNAFPKQDNNVPKLGNPRGDSAVRTFLASTFPPFSYTICLPFSFFSDRVPIASVIQAGYPVRKSNFSSRYVEVGP